ncbi:MAG: PIN domain-containing protein [Myxococcota bacterium]
MSRPLNVFVDTNILLEFQRLDHAGWSAVFANRPATFVLSAAVVREVDKARGATKLRLQKRARSLLLWLRERLRDATPLANGAALEFYPPTPVSVLERGELHPTFPDDVILASAIHYSEQHADRDVVFVSEDTGALIRAEGFGLACASPPADLRLPAELSGEERELRDLREKVQRLETATPAIWLSAGAEPTRIFVNRFDKSEESWVTRTMAQERTKWTDVGFAGDRLRRR